MLGPVCLVWFNYDFQFFSVICTSNVILFWIIFFLHPSWISFLFVCYVLSVLLSLSSLIPLDHPIKQSASVSLMRDWLCNLFSARHKEETANMLPDLFSMYYLHESIRGNRLHNWALYVFLQAMYYIKFPFSVVKSLKMYLYFYFCLDFQHFFSSPKGFLCQTVRKF